MTIEAGVIFGTILGFVLYETIGFRLGADVFFFMQIPMLLLFFCCGGVLQDCRRCRRGEPMLRRTTTEIETPPPVGGTARELKDEGPEDLNTESPQKVPGAAVNEF